MHIKELQKDKKELEEELFILLRRFELKTNTHVVDINYDSCRDGVFIVKEGKCYLDVRVP